MYALCVSGAVNTQGFVWIFFLSAIYKFLFIYTKLHHSRGHCTFLIFVENFFFFFP